MSTEVRTEQTEASPRERDREAIKILRWALTKCSMSSERRRAAWAWLDDQEAAL